jgi:hypothetical protein
MITSFVDTLLNLKDLHRLVTFDVAATGPQKNIAELINVQFLGSIGVDEEDYQHIFIL